MNPGAYRRAAAWTGGPPPLACTAGNDFTEVHSNDIVPGRRPAVQFECGGGEGHPGPM